MARTNLLPLFLLAAIAGIVVDQASKWWVRQNLVGQHLTIIPGFFELRYRQNFGSAFGLKLLGIPGLTLITVVVSLVLLFFLFRGYFGQHFWGWMGVALFLAGAWGNLIDRLSLGFVVDFFFFPFWPTFNFADIFIIIGAVFFLVGLWGQAL